ncbi:MAG: rhodanese-like domain-containing protein [Flavobacteriales bacterium]|nr:rhodanese-like domain-containing protein [Flavobacteriales bacterium]
MITMMTDPCQCSIIDLRWEDQYAMGHIQGSINIPSDNILSSLDELRNMHQPILLCCQSGYRTRIAARVLRRNGLSVIEGGDYRALSREYGLPLEVF